MKTIIIHFFLLSFCSVAYSQILDGVYIPGEGNIKKVVESKSRYKFIPKQNSISTSELTFFERFDSLGRVIEEKDINLDGTMYAWSFYTYDKNGNVVQRRVLNADSSLMYNHTNTFDKLNRTLIEIGIEPSGKVRFRSKHEYYKDSTVYVGWFDDSTHLSTIIDHINTLGRTVKEIIYNGVGHDKQISTESFFEYKDTTIQKKTVLNYENGIFKWGEEFFYDKHGNQIQKFSITSNKIYIIEEVMKYDNNRRETYKKGYDHNRTYYVYHWKNEYDSLNRPVCTEKYCDTLDFKPYKGPIATKDTYEYQGYGKVIKTISNYFYGMGQSVTITNYDDQDLWLNTTKTIDGTLCEYRYAVYEYKEIKDGEKRLPIKNKHQ